MRFTLIVSVLFAAALMLAGPVQPMPPESHVATTASTSSFSELLGSADALVIEATDSVSLEMVADLVMANGGAVKSSYSSTCLMSVSLGGSPEGLLDKISGAKKR